MITRTHLDNGVASLATLWGVQPNQVAERLAINLDFSHVEPKNLSARAKRAKCHENTKYAKKVAPYTKRTFSDVVETTTKMIDNPKTFRKLRSMLIKAAFAQTQDRMEAEDIVQQTIFRLCFCEANDEEHLFRLSRQIFRRIIAEYWYKRCNSPIDVAPYEDFYLMEEVLGWCDEDGEAEAQPIQPTADIGEAFLRVAAELTKQLGRKYAAVACGMREKTFARILPS